MLKIDLHMHTNEDPQDTFIKHSSKQLIDHFASLGYDAIAITCHDAVIHRTELAEYAQKKGILLIPGCERTIEGRHTLLYNFTQKETEKIKTFEDLRKIKKKHHLVIAPHPFFPHGASLREKLAENADLFDAVECSQFYTENMNFNKKALWFAHTRNMPVVGNSDTHMLWHTNGTTYSLVEAEKTTAGVVDAIKSGKVELATTEMPLRIFISTMIVLPMLGALTRLDRRLTAIFQ